MIALAKKLHRSPVNGKRRSLREVADDMAKQGYVGPNGQLYAAMIIKRMIEV
jgi:hypothetical protein